MFKQLLGAIAVSVLTISTAHAALIVASGNNPQTDNNVISGGACAGVDGPALALKACLNGQNTPIVNITSDENIIYAAGGQAKVDGATGDYSRLSISIDGLSLGTVILNIDTTADGWVRFTDGTDTSTTFALDVNGQNFFTITGGPFPFISFTTYSNEGGTTEADIVDVTEQIRIGSSETTTTEVPEPASMTLLAGGLLGLGALLRRRRRRA